jgi:hypothetical protein
VVIPQSVGLDDEDQPRRRRFAPGFGCQRVEKWLEHNRSRAERDALEDRSAIELVRCNHLECGVSDRHWDSLVIVGRVRYKKDSEDNSDTSSSLKLPPLAR